LLTLMLLVLTGCGALLQTPQERKAEEERLSKLMDQRLNDHKYEIEVNFMMPMRGGSTAVNGYYSVTIDGEEINSHLPYAGVAQSIPYGGGNGLNFKGKIEEYIDDGWVKGSRKIFLKADNGDGILEYHITVSDEGSAYITVNSRNRDTISFSGNFVTREEIQ